MIFFAIVLGINLVFCVYLALEENINYKILNKQVEQLHEELDNIKNKDVTAGMSYDIRFGVKVAGAKDVYAIIGRPEYDSPTYNNRDIFVHSMDWDYEQGKWYPMNEVLPKVQRGIHELTYHKKEYTQYEPDNGWGGIPSALKCLKSISEYFYPEQEWNREWDEDIPLECIYMRW